MTDNTQPEALRLALSIDLMDTFTDYQQEELGKAAAELRRQHARITELEAELEAVGAGGVQALSAAPAVPEPPQATSDPIQAAADAASVGHLSRLLDHQSAMLAGAMKSMRAIELAASPIDESHGDFDARIPSREWAAFVDARAALLHDFAQSPVASPTPPAGQQAAPKAAPVVWLSSKQLRGVTALYGQYLPFRCQPEGRFDTPVYLAEAAPKAAPGEPSDAEIDAFLDSPGGIEWVIADKRERYRLLVRAALAKWAAPQQEAQEPYAYAVYFPDQPKVELVHDLDELIDDLTNRQHTITKLYTAPRPAPDCHHRPPCNECAALAAKERQP